jgi:hypothetical protein
MSLPIGRAIVDAAVFAVRALGSVQGLLVVRPPPPTKAARPGAAPVRGISLGHTQLSTTTRYAHHNSQRLVATASTAARAWNLLPDETDAEKQP